MGHLSQVRSAFYFVGSFSHLHCWAKDCVNVQGCTLWLYIAYIANSLQKTNLKNDGNTKRWPTRFLDSSPGILKELFYQAFCISLMFHFHWWPPQGGRWNIKKAWKGFPCGENRPPHRKKNCWSTWKTILQYCRWKWTKSVSKELSIKNRSLNKTSNQFERRILMATLHLSGQSHITAQVRWLT